MLQLTPTSPLGFAVLLLQDRFQRARRSEGGASAVEWVVIAAILVTIVIVVGAILRNALEGKAEEVGDRIDGT